MEEQKNSEDVQEHKEIAAVGYLFFLCFIPLFVAKDSEFAQFHAKQGLTLFIIELILIVIGSIPLIGWILFLPISIAELILFIISIIGFVKAWKGEKYSMPIIANLADRIKS